MKSKKTLLVLSFIVAVEFVVVAGLCIRDSKAECTLDVEIRELAPRTVLYTIYRGHFAGIGHTINQLYQLAIAKGLRPCGPVSTGYLNNPLSVSSEHWLIEIQIPVDASALELSGKLGDITDVKSLPAMKVAVAAKPQGHADPASIVCSLYSWINRQGYIVVGKLWQSVVSNEVADYPQMETEFIVPISPQTAAADFDFVVRRAVLI